MTQELENLCLEEMEDQINTMKTINKNHQCQVSSLDLLL